MSIFVQTSGRVSIVCCNTIANLDVSWFPRTRPRQGQVAGLVIFATTKQFVVVDHQVHPRWYNYKLDEDIDLLIAYFYPTGLELLVVSEEQFDTKFHVIGAGGEEMVSMVPHERRFREFCDVHAWLALRCP